MSEMTAGPVPGRMRNKQVLWIVGLGLLVVAVVSGFLVIRGRAADTGPLSHPTHAVSAQAIEDRWGIRIEHIAVTADGGMVEFRYRVTDPEKAIDMAHDINKMPVLITADNRSLINSAAAMTDKRELQAGTTYFILYRNAGGAIKSGSTVSVVFGDQRLERQPVK